MFRIRSIKSRSARSSIYIYAAGVYIVYVTFTKKVMFLVPYVCICMFICLVLGEISQKLLDRLSGNLV